MIVVQVADPHLRQAVCRAAHPEEDVVTGVRLGSEAIEWGYPRLVVRVDGDGPGPPAPAIATLVINRVLLRRWEEARRSLDFPPTRLDHLTQRLVVLMRPTSAERTWVDRTLAELAKAAGAQLPPPLRSFARRVLEFPTHYTDLRSIADTCGTSRGALKARFRRRALASPHAYLRWFRILAVADQMSGQSITVAEAARRFGFTSGGNLCRTMADVAGVTPTEGRTPAGRRRLLISFAQLHLTPNELEAWASLDGLFVRDAA